MGITHAERHQVAQNQLATVGLLAGILQGELLGGAEPVLLAQQMG